MGGHHDAGQWPVLDVGGEVGALIVYLAAVPASGELEAQPLGRPDRRIHTGVHLRPLSGRLLPVALFPEVSEGVYELLDEDLGVLATVEVEGGRVQTQDLQEAVPVPR